MKERLIQFLRDNNLSSAKFADMVGVQRSSISHILAGRNKPSYDFIEKMLVAFPNVDVHWLITGKLSNKPENKHLFSNLEENMSTPGDLPKSVQDFTKHKIDGPGEVNAQSVLPVNLNSARKVERVIIFYTDGSFKDYARMNENT